MLSKRKRYKRRNFYVKKGFQSQFILQFAALVVAGGVLSTLLVLYFSSGNLTSSFSNSRLQVDQTIWYILPAVVYTNLITIIIATVGVMLIALFVSHKIAGPLFRFEMDIKTIGTGDLTNTIYLRKHDQLNELSEDINHMTTSLSQTLQGFQKDIAQIIGHAVTSNAPQWYVEQLQQVHDKFEESFKLRE